MKLLVLLLICTIFLSGCVTSYFKVELPNGTKAEGAVVTLFKDINIGDPNGVHYASTTSTQTESILGTVFGFFAGFWLK